MQRGAREHLFQAFESLDDALAEFLLVCSGGYLPEGPTTTIINVPGFGRGRD